MTIFSGIKLPGHTNDLGITRPGSHELEDLRCSVRCVVRPSAEDPWIRVCLLCGMVRPITRWYASSS